MVCRYNVHIECKHTTFRRTVEVITRCKRPIIYPYKSLRNVAYLSRFLTNCRVVLATHNISRYSLALTAC